MTINKYVKSLYFSLVCGLSILLTACATVVEPEPEPVMVNVSINATKELNPAVDGRASPLVIRLYQLSQKVRFDNSDFFALYENDQATLANELLSRTEFEIKPGDSKQTQLKLKPNTQFIAILGAFRDLDNSQWKDVTPYSVQEEKPLSISIGSTSVALEVK